MLLAMTISNNMMKIPEKIKTEIDKCNQCGKCLSVCPTYWVTADECDTTRGLQELIRNVYSGTLEVSEKFIKHLFLCVSCRACTEVCPSNIAIDEVLDWARSQYAASCKRKAVDTQMPYTASIEMWKEYLVLQIAAKKETVSFLTSIPEKVGKKNAKHRVGLFVGCLMDVGYQQSAASIVEWLVDHQYEVIIPKEQGCCGMPAITLGNIKSAQDAINKNIEIYHHYGVKAVVTGCAHCAFMIRNRWKMIADKEPFAIFHIAEIIAKFKKTNYPQKNSRNRVGYQPACLLHRGLGVTANINQLFAKSISNYVELKHAVTCCGQAGISGFLYPEITKLITARQIDKYTQAKIDCLLTNCPLCNLSYDKQKKGNIKTISLTEYISY
jgi:glycolate oxidase iron-sulfur subunit